jgi:hypothetical protein
MPVLNASATPVTTGNRLRFVLISNTGCLLRLIGFFALLRLLRTLCLHLLDSHVMFVVPDALLALAGELRPPLATAFLCLGQRLLLG